MRLPLKFFSSAIIYVVANAISVLPPLILLPILTRVLTPEDYGLAVMFGVMVQLLGALTGLSVHGAIGVRYFERERLDYPRFVGTCMSLLLASVIVMLAVVWLTQDWLVHFTKLPKEWLLIAVLVAGASFVVQSQLAIFQSAERPRDFALLRLFQALVDVALSLLLVTGLHLAWQGRAFGTAIAFVSTALIALLWMWRGGWLTFAFTKTYAKSALRFGLPLVPHALGGVFIATADRFLITNLLGVSSAGIYMVAVQMAAVLALLMDACNRALYPRLMRALSAHDPDLDRLVVRGTYAGFAMMHMVSVAYGVGRASGAQLTSGWIIQRSYGPRLVVGQWAGLCRHVFRRGEAVFLAGLID